MEIQTDEAVVTSDQQNVEVVNEPKVDDEADRGAKKAIHDLHKFKSEAQKLKEEVQALREREKQREHAQMRQNQEYEKLAEVYKQEAEEAREKYNRVSQSVAYEKRYTAVREAALKAGIREQALQDLDLLDLNAIELETTSTGRVNVLGADDFVNRLKVTRPYWFGRRSANLNSETPDIVSGQGVTYDDLLKAEKRAKETGDSAPYQKLILQYKKQLNGG